MRYFINKHCNIYELYRVNGDEYQCYQVNFNINRDWKDGSGHVIKCLYSNSNGHIKEISHEEYEEILLSIL